MVTGGVYMEISEKQKMVIGLIAEILDMDISELSPETMFIDLEEWDSMAHLQIIGEFEDKFHVDIPIEKIKDITNIKELIDCLI
jgi:acyl carrier protein